MNREVFNDSQREVEPDPRWTLVTRLWAIFVYAFLFLLFFGPAFAQDLEESLDLPPAGTVVFANEVHIHQAPAAGQDLARYVNLVLERLRLREELYSHVRQQWGTPDPQGLVICGSGTGRDCRRVR